MTDAFSGFSNVEWGPYEVAVAVTPSDATPLAAVTRGVYIGGAGNLAVTIGGANIVFTAPPVGTILPIRCTHIRATSTTATLIVALS